MRIAGLSFVLLSVAYLVLSATHQLLVISQTIGCASPAQVRLSLKLSMLTGRGLWYLVWPILSLLVAVLGFWLLEKAHEQNRYSKNTSEA